MRLVNAAPIYAAKPCDGLLMNKQVEQAAENKHDPRNHTKQHEIDA